MDKHHPFEHAVTIRLHHTDAAGRLFYAWKFALMHESYEAFLEHIGMPLHLLLGSSELVMPIVHAEADFRNPLLLGQKIRIAVAVERIGQTSFTVAYTVSDESGQGAGSGKTVHVCVNKQTGRTIPIPDALRAALERGQ